METRRITRALISVLLLSCIGCVHAQTNLGYPVTALPNPANTNGGFIEARGTNLGIRGLTASQYSNNNGPALITLRKTRGTYASPSTVANGDHIGYVQVEAYDGSSYLNSAYIEFVVNGSVSGGTVPVDIILRAGVSSGGEVLRVRNDGAAIVTGNLGSGSVYPFEVQSTGSGSRGPIVTQYSTNAFGPLITLQKARGSTASPTTVANNDNIGQIIFQAYDGTNYQQPGLIQMKINGTVSGGSTPADMIFGAGAASATEILRLAYDSNGGHVLITGNLGAGSSNQVEIQSTGAGARGLSISEYRTGNQGALINFYKARGSVTSPSAVTSGDHLAQITPAGYDGSAFTGLTYIDFLVNGSVSGGNVPTDIVMIAGNNETFRVRSDNKNIFSGDMLPGTDNTYSLGSASFAVKDAYFKGTINSHSIIPLTDNSYDLGSSSFTWRDGYFKGTINSHTVIPLVDNAYDLGSSSFRFANITFGTALKLSSNTVINSNQDATFRNLNLSGGTLTEYDTISTENLGAAPIFSYKSFTGQTATVALTSMQVGGSDAPAGLYRVSLDVICKYGGSGSSAGSVFPQLQWYWDASTTILTTASSVSCSGGSGSAGHVYASVSAQTGANTPGNVWTFWHSGNGPIQVKGNVVTPFSNATYDMYVTLQRLSK